MDELTANFHRLSHISQSICRERHCFVFKDRIDGIKRLYNIWSFVPSTMVLQYHKVIQLRCIQTTVNSLWEIKHTTFWFFLFNWMWNWNFRNSELGHVCSSQPLPPCFLSSHSISSHTHIHTLPNQLTFLLVYRTLTLKIMFHLIRFFSSKKTTKSPNNYIIFSNSIHFEHCRCSRPGE